MLSLDWGEDVRIRQVPRVFFHRRIPFVHVALGFRSAALQSSRYQVLTASRAPL